MTRNPYERAYGYRYAETQRGTDGQSVYLGAAQIAKLIRADIKQAVAEGLLPKHWKYSVRSESYSMGRSINVRVSSGGEAWRVCDGGQECRDVWCANRNDPKYLPEHRHEHYVLTPEGDAAKMTLRRIHDAYNYDGSDSQTDYFDVNYYGHVEFSSAKADERQAEQKAKDKARKQETDSGTVAAKVVVYGRRTRHVHVLVQLADGQRLACGAARWRHSMWSKTNDDATPTCTRCAKWLERKGDA